MRFEKHAVEVLENFANINANILFRKGTEVRTISSAKNIFSIAKLEEDILQEFAIFDLSNFLSVLSMCSSNLEFKEKSLVVPTDVGKIEYYFSNPELILAAPEKNIVVDKMFTFQLSADDVTKILKIGALLGSPHVSVKAKGGKAELSLGDRKNSSANMFKKDIGEFDDDFDVFVSLDALKILPRDYEVSISKKKIIYFKASDIEYWISVDAGSKI